VRNWELVRSAVRPLWQEADNLRERVAEAAGLFAFFSFDSALAQRASHGHLRTHPAARSALVRLCAAPHSRAAVLSARPVETLQRRLRLNRLAYVGVHGADVQAPGLRLVTEPDREKIEIVIARLRRACSRVPALKAPGIALEDRIWALALHLRHSSGRDSIAAAEAFGQLAATEDLQLRRGVETLEACAPGPGIGRAALGLLAGVRSALAVYVGAGELDEEGFGAINRAGGLSVHVGAPPSTTQARYKVESGGEVIRLIHWLADARRR
jgi:trehalose 6-phosphate phosphatase